MWFSGVDKDVDVFWDIAALMDIRQIGKTEFGSIC
jgi:hypothetical protein